MANKFDSIPERDKISWLVDLTRQSPLGLSEDEGQKLVDKFLAEKWQYYDWFMSQNLAVDQWPYLLRLTKEDQAQKLNSKWWIVWDRFWKVKPVTPKMELKIKIRSDEILNPTRRRQLEKYLRDLLTDSDSENPFSKAILQIEFDQ